MNLPLTVVVLTRNEADNIERCLSSIRWCNDVVLIDDSTDDTVKIAQQVLPRTNLHIIREQRVADFAWLRNFALTKAKNTWVFFLDADEEVTPEQTREIHQVINNTSCNGYYVYRKDYFLGKWLKFGETGKSKLLKLGRKDKGQWQRSVHEVWEIEGKVGELNTPLLHYPHPTIAEFMSRINRWTNLDAQEFYNQGVTSNFWKIIAYPLGKFLVNYVIRKGIRDSMPGLIFAISMSFHSFLTRTKLYILNQEFKSRISDS